MLGQSRGERNTRDVAALTLAIVVGGSMVLAGAVLCAWVVGSYPPGTAYPLALLACLIPAAAAGIALVLLLRQHSADRADSVHPLLDVLAAASRAGPPTGALILTCFVAGALAAARGSRASARHPNET